MSVIVVGVDHSAGANAALRFAAEEARFRDATIHAVHAWQYGYIGYVGPEGSVPLVGADIEQLRSAAEAALEASVREALPDTDVEIKLQAIQGTPAGVLVEASAGADLLVVGSRGHGGFAGLLLGSVSQQCAHHAACPVVIVHPRRAQAPVS
jgi:nucleotide-binding universal stress UspA family protein